MVCFMESLAESERTLDTTEVSKGSIFFNMLAMMENLWSSFEFHVEKTVVGWVWVILFYLIVDGGWVWVILGLCWVSSSMEKTVAGGWVWVILGLCWVCERILERGVGRK